MDRIEYYSRPDLIYQYYQKTVWFTPYYYRDTLLYKSNFPLSRILKHNVLPLLPPRYTVEFTILAELAPTHNRTTATTIPYGTDVHIIDNGRVSVFWLDRPHDPHIVPTPTHWAIYLFNGLLISLFLRILWGLTMRDILFFYIYRAR